MRQQDVAKAVGVSVQAVSQWERGDNDISMENLRTAAQFLGFDAVTAFRGELRLSDSDEAPSEVERVTDVGRPDLGPRDVPLSGVSLGGEDADFSFNGEVADYVRRPPGIANLRNVFALHVIGDSMVPRFEPADIIYCGGRPPVPGDDVVIEMFPSESAPAGRGYIKRLVARTSSIVTVRQFNPPREIQFDAYELKAVHRVIPWKELLGF